MFGQPPLLVLDEPTAGLDTHGIEHMRRALSALKAEGTTIVILGHQPAFLELADKVMVLKGGSPVAYGRRDNVLRPVTAQVHPVEAKPDAPQIASAQ